MKTALLLLSAGLVCTTVQAQIPVNRTQAMVQKATASWCPACGGSGFATQEAIAADNMVGATPNAIVYESHGSLGSYHTDAADSMTLSWIGNSIPKWGVNNINRTDTTSMGYINLGGTQANVKKIVDSLVKLAPVASSGFYYTINGTTITFRTATRFWKAASGTYAIAAYILEDSIHGPQATSSNPNDSAWHRYVFRGHINNAVFGEQIVNGSVAINQVFTKNFTFKITKTDWNKARLSFFTVIWKKNGTDWNSWEVVNVNSVKSNFSNVGIDNVPDAVDQLIMYPNPAADRIHISGALTMDANAKLSLVNAIGQTVYEKTVSYNAAQLSEDIVTSHLSNGVYTLLIRSEGGQTLRKLVVAH